MVPEYMARLGVFGTVAGMETLDTQERRHRLATRHGLVATAMTVQEAAERLVGLHSSDPVTVYLSCRARVPGFSIEGLEQALYEDKALLRLLGMRRTLFVVPRDLAAVLDAGCARLLYQGERRRLAGYLESQGVAGDGDKWIESVESKTLAALADLGEATANELREVVPELKLKLAFGEGKKWGGEVGVSTRMLFLLATAGAIVRGRPLGSWLSTQYRWAPIDGWVEGGLEDIDTFTAQVALVRRWLGSYGPGTFTDVKWWTGWGVQVTRAALEACGAVEVDLEGEIGFVLADDLAATPEPGPWAAFLPSLDSTVMGWKEREWYLGEHMERLFDRNGNAGPTIWCNGRVVGGWAACGDGVRIQFLEDVATSEERLVRHEADTLAAWLKNRPFTPRFRTPVEKLLLGAG
jgi:hypothetical protein